MGWDGVGIELMGMGGNGNVESHSRTSLVETFWAETRPKTYWSETETLSTEKKRR